MTNFLLFVRTIFGGAWSLFKTTVPGFNFTYADIIVALLLASAGLAIFHLLFGFSGSVHASPSSLGRSSRNPKISDERKNDEK